MKKKLLALLLCLVMAVGILPTAAMAEEGDSRHPEVQFTIVKKVVKAENAATPPAETFAFELEDTADEKKTPATYGIELDELKIQTNGADDYVKTVKARIDMAKVNPNGGWESIIPVGGQTASSYYKTFHITEKNDRKDGWEYSTAKYAVTFKYDLEAQNMTCGVYEIGNDVSFRSADFTNTYTKAEETGRIAQQQFTITKTVKKTETAVTPPAETFEFVLEDTAQEKKPLDYYGITLLDELKISTNGVGVYETTANVQIDLGQVNENNGWTPGIPVGSQTISWYSKTFHITEKNDGKDGWSYCSEGYEAYAVTFKYDCETNEMTCTLHERGNDVTFRTADFTNTYTKQEQAKKAIELPFTVTVKQGGNVAPGKQTFELEIFEILNRNANEYRDVTYTASVETNGVKDYEGKLVITGPEDQLEQFTCEGFYVREKDTKAANWEYSNAVWYVTPNLNGGYNICPAELKTSDNGDYYEPDRENAAEKMTFVNTYTENKTVTPGDTKSPQTGDNSNMIPWIALLFVSGGVLAGTTLYSRKRKSVK